MKPFIVDKNKTPEYEALAPNTRFARFLIDASLIKESNLSIATFRYEPGQIGPAHTHSKETEVYYILKGQGTLRLGEQVVQLRPDVVVYIPAGLEHETRNTGDGELEFLGIFAPALDFGSMKSNWSQRKP